MKNFIACSISSVLFFSLLSCSSSPNRNTANTSATTIVFSERRFLNTEPCGCSLGQLGGLEREANYLKRLRGSGVDPLYFAGSGGFVPEHGYDRRDLKQYEAKASAIAQGMAHMQVKAYFPDQADLQIGLKLIQGFATKYAVSYISSNLMDVKSGEPLFKDKMEFSHNGQNHLVLGLSAPSTLNIGDIKKAKVLDPATVLRKNLAAHSNSLVTVVHSLDHETVLELMSEFPQVTFWLGGDRNVYPDEVFQHSKTAFKGEVQGWGRSLLEIEFDGHSPIAELYHPDQRRFQLSRLKLLNETAPRADEVESSALRRKLLSGLEATPSSGAATYSYRRVDLGSDFEERSRASVSGE